MKRNKIGNIIGIALCVLLLPIAVVNVSLAVQSYLHPERVATFLGMGPLIVETGSMLPEIAPGDVVIAKKCDTSKLEKGEVIAYYDAKGIIVTHRIIAFDTGENGARLYTTKGDNNNVQDQNPVPQGKILGRVVKVFPDGGKVFRTLGEPLVIVLVVGVPLLLAFGLSSLLKTLAARKARHGKSGGPSGDPEDNPKNGGPGEGKEGVPGTDASQTE